MSYLQKVEMPIKTLTCVCSKTPGISVVIHVGKQS